MANGGPKAPGRREGPAEAAARAERDRIRERLSKGETPSKGRRLVLAGVLALAGIVGLIEGVRSLFPYRVIGAYRQISEKEKEGLIEEMEKKCKGRCVWDDMLADYVGRPEPGKAAAMLKAPAMQGPLAKFRYNRKKHMAREECLKLFLAASDDLKEATGKRFDLNSALRTPSTQEGVYDRSFGEGKTGKVKKAIGWQKSAAAEPHFSPHAFCAFDIGTNPKRDPNLADWHEAIPFMEKHGFIGGFTNGLGDELGEPIDPFHFDHDRLLKPTGKESAKRARNRYCNHRAKLFGPKKFEWHCTIIEEREKKAAEEKAKEKAKGKKKAQRDARKRQRRYA